MFCPKCGTQNVDNAAFCAKCGNKLAGGSTPNMGPGPAPNMGQNPQSNMGYGYAPGTQQGTGLQPNVAALLSYIAGWITGLIFYFVEKDKFVRFHAMQSILLSGAVTILQIILAIIPAPIFSAFFVIKSIIGTIIWIGMIILWILCMIKAYSKEWFKLPVVGNYAQQFSQNN